MSSSEREAFIINPQNSNTSKSVLSPEELRNQGELLRVKANIQINTISEVWKLEEEELEEYFTHYEPMPHSQVLINSLFELPHVKIFRSDNKVYFGQIEQKKKHGKGTKNMITGIVLYRQGKLYEGDFLFNEKSGFGCEIYTNGNLYVGHFAQNKKHGKGSFFWYSLCENQQQKQIEQYHGDWWGGLPDGFGQHHRINGDVYVGAFKNGLKHGDGYEIYANGEKYKGQFVNGLPEGYGEYHWAGEESYKGDFKQGARNGYGIWKGKLELYKGHFMLDKKHGYGIYDWGNGHVYKGQWMEDYRHGEGIMMLNGEPEYDGFWENGEKADERPTTNPVTARPVKQSGVRGGSASKRMDIYGNSRVDGASRGRNPSIQKNRSRGKDQFSLSFQREGKSLQKSKCRHKNCIPQQIIGKMPKPDWKT